MPATKETGKRSVAPKRQLSSYQVCVTYEDCIGCSMFRNDLAQRQLCYCGHAWEPHGDDAGYVHPANCPLCKLIQLATDYFSTHKFFDLYAKGLLTEDDVDDYVEAWHTDPRHQDLSSTVEPLHAYLGLSWDEFGNWLSDFYTLPKILYERMKND